MVDTFATAGYNGSGWTIDTTGGYVGFFGAAGPGYGITPGGFNASTHETNALGAVDSCSPHMRNTKYVSATEVSLQEAAAVTLNTTNVQTTHCTLRWYYNDSVGATVTENGLLFAFNGADPAVNPVGCTVLAAERGLAAINKDRDSDTPGDGYAWHSSYGIGTVTNALILEDQLSMANHYYYLLISVSPTQKGLASGAIRWEADVS